MIRNPQDLYTTSFLPSRKIRILLAIIIGVAILVWLVPHVWVWVRTPGTGKTLPEPINPTITTPSDSYLDSDDDGIPDWKEQFLKNYGVIQGEDGESSASETLALLDEIPDTQKIALEIAAQVKEGSALATGAITEQTIRDYVISLTKDFKNYTIYDIAVTERETINEQILYAKEMEALSADLNKTIDKKNTQELFDLYGGNITHTQAAQIMRNNLRIDIEKMLTIATPPSAVSVHLELINTLYQFYQILGLTIPEGKTDLIRSYALITLAQESVYGFFNAQIRMASYFFITLDPSMY